jgi:ATP-dependent protease ClpP protease subunit
LDETQPGARMSDYFFGFNVAIEEQAIANLISTVQGAIVSGATGLTVCLTSRGGDYAQAAYAYEILSGLPLPVSMHAIGTVRLSAVTLFMAGTRRYAAAGTDFLLGEAFAGPRLRLDHQEVIALDEVGRVDCLDRLAIERMAKATGRPASEVTTWLDGKRFLDTEFALDNGIVHEIRPLQIPPGAVFLQIS